MGVRWEQAVGTGIQVGAHDDVWHSGHIEDVWPLDGGVSGLLVATNSGGVWTATAGGAVPLSDAWDQPDTYCLAGGPDGPRHVYAGGKGGSLRETKSQNLFDWQPVDEPLPGSAGDVRRILVLPRHRRIVAVCASGVFWSVTDRPGAPRYSWRPAVEADRVGGYWDGTIAGTRDVERPGQDDLEFVTVVTGATAGGIVTGAWEGPDLVMRPALGMPAALAASVATSDMNATRVYAAAAIKNTDGSTPERGELGAFCRSDDGGRNWALQPAEHESGQPLSHVVGQKGHEWNNCLAVMPDQPGVVLLGWQKGSYISADAGLTWRQVVADRAHLHADVHCLRFGVAGPGGEPATFVGSDGGVVEIDSASLLRYGVTGSAAGLPACRSTLNRHLPTLECYSTTSTNRHFAGTLAVASDGGRDVVSSGTQDNGNVVTEMDGSPWLKVTGGDGGWNGLWRDDLFTTIMNDADLAQHSLPGPPFYDWGKVVIGREGVGALAPSALDPVRRPSFRNVNGDLMVQVAGAGGTDRQQRGVYGLFADAGRQHIYHWERLGDVPDDLSITAVASPTGAMVWVGTSGGRIFALDSGGAAPPVETPVPPPTKPTGVTKDPSAHWIMRLACDWYGSAFAVMTAKYGAARWQSDVLRLDGLHWIGTRWTPTVGARVEDRIAFGLEVVRHERGEYVFVSTDSQVYASDNAGDVWHVVSDGLPTRAHNADLRYGLRAAAGPGRGAYLYLSTFGRSLWRARMDDLDHG